jgi:hypothetical protein
MAILRLRGKSLTNAQIEKNEGLLHMIIHRR